MKIKELREKKGITQETLAKELGYKYQSAIAMIESGERRLPVDKLPIVAEVLGCQIADLFEKNNPSVSAEPSQLPLGKGALGEAAEATSDTLESNKA